MFVGNYHKMEVALYTWFTQEGSRGTPLSGPLLVEQALFYDHEINGETSEFKASLGWLDRFKQRHGIR